MKLTKRIAAALLLILPLILATAAIAEEKEMELGRWYPAMDAGLNMTQSAYSNNWSGGDKGSIVWTLNLNADLENQLSTKLNWKNTLKLAFGQTHNQDRDATGATSWDRPEKSTDLIDFTSLFRFTLGGFVDPYASVRLESQFQDGTDGAGRIINFNPILISEAAGMARVFINEEERELISRVGFALHQNRRSFFSVAAPGTETTSESSTDGGIEWITDYKTRILDDEVSWTSQLNIYQPLFFSGKDDLDILDQKTILDTAGNSMVVDTEVGDYSTFVDVAWENILTTNITEHLTVNFYLQWKYDKYDNSVVAVTNDAGEVTNGELIAAAIRKAGQFKQTLALGLTYSFF